tara:strand:+ start:307 stop:1116 length:810 start_codon:yes stop_codon:yes gene_type:complete
MKWYDLNPDYKKTENKVKVTKGATSTTKSDSGSGTGRKIYNSKELREIVTKKFPTRSRRKIWMSEEGKSRGTPQWEVTRESVVSARAKHKQKTNKWVDIPKNELDKGAISGQKRVTEKTGKAYWRGAYTGKKITDPKLIDVDHVVPIFRAAASEQFGDNKFRKLSQKHEFVRNTKNLVISTRKENRDVKQGFGLSKWQPPMKEARPKYAQAYHDVFQHYGMKMTVGEATKYTELTGKEPTVGLWNQEDSNKMNTWMENERAKSMRSRNK